MAQYGPLLKVIAVFLTALGMVAGAAIWASAAHSEVDANATAKDAVQSSELKKHMEESYTKKTDHVRLEQAFVDQKEDVREIKQGVNDIKEFLMNRRGSRSARPRNHPPVPPGSTVHTLP